MARVQFVHCATSAGGEFARVAAAGGGPQQRRGAGASAGGKGVAAAAAAFEAAGFSSWVCPRVRHCYDAFGLVLVHKDGWKVVFSGDTMPSDVLARYGHDATLLIHEATFADDRADDAVTKRHSTAGGALQAAESMHAWRVILTHFSQRYGRYAPDLWGTESAGTSHPGNTGVQGCERALERAAPAFDGMMVPFSALEGLPAVARGMMAYLTESRCEATERTRAEMFAQQ